MTVPLGVIWNRLVGVGAKDLFCLFWTREFRALVFWFRKSTVNVPGVLEAVFKTMTAPAPFAQLVMCSL